jgi:tetratricopeptide (TPR) repeat protein
MKNPVILLCLILFSCIVWGQPSQDEIARIRAQMAKIRQTTNWDDPAAAKKANEEIQKLARQMTGNPAPPAQNPGQQPPQVKKQEPANFALKIAPTKDNIVAIADRFYQRSLKTLDAISKSQFNQDWKAAENEKFSLKAVRKLTTAGATLITFGNDHNLACVYLASAIKALPTDTLAINNFGGYLRIIDSIQTSLPVLLYANKLFAQSPVILTQIGCSYFELKDYVQAEKYLKEALKYNPDFGQAHTALCELYIQQKKLREAILELFAGVKGMGASYSQASGSFNQIQQQYNSAGGSGASAKEEFWNETKNQIKPNGNSGSAGGASEKAKMPSFELPPRVEDWLEGGGFINAVQTFAGFGNYMQEFVAEFQQVHNQVPVLPPNAYLRDYPNERFALDCITEMFFKESKDKDDKYKEELDKIIDKVNKAKEQYIQDLLKFTEEFKSCADGCGTDGACVEQCHRKFCQKECPNANNFNKLLRYEYNEWVKAYQKYVQDQEKTLNDLYGFSQPWLQKIYSPYWNRIYSWEVKRVALSVIGNCYAYYPQAFQNLSHNSCGEDCSVWADNWTISIEADYKKKPKAPECDQKQKVSIGVAMCGIDFECESIEIGCAAVLATSLKRNFKNKSTTVFIGVGVEAEFGVAKAGAKAGFTLTKTAGGDTDVGVKGEVSGTVGGPISAGKNYEVSATVMEGVKVEGKNVIGIGF